MIQKAETLVITIVLVAFYCNLAQAQSMAPVLITIDTENFVEYQGDVVGGDPSKLGINPNVTPPVSPRSFSDSFTGIADIVAVNGQPARGTMTSHAGGVPLTPNPISGQGIADVMRASFRYQAFEILKSDGTAVGTIVAMGLNGGPPPPGSPLAQTAQNHAIIGGTGAFLGALGQYGNSQNAQTVAARLASMAEDPANRRINGGGRVRFILTLIPLSRPGITQTIIGPAVTHSGDFSVVTASRPAAPGEVLSLFATGLGPTRPGVDPGKPFPATPLSVVNSQVEVLVNGRAAEVLAAAGFPGSVDGYQVNFRIPADAAPGMATIQVSAAWIPGPPVSIAIQ